LFAIIGGAALVVVVVNGFHDKYKLKRILK
jgi:hypothetical protein